MLVNAVSATEAREKAEYEVPDDMWNEIFEDFSVDIFSVGEVEDGDAEDDDEDTDENDETGQDLATDPSTPVRD